MTDTQQPAGTRSAASSHPPTAERSGTGDPYLLSYLRLSFAIGAAGALLPIVLVLGDWLLSQGWDVRGSMSAYYHSGVRDVFVGMLVVIGFFLVTYHVASRRYINVTTTVAGLLATGVALFPTKREGAAETLVQQWLGGADNTRVLHFACAIPFLILLGFLSAWFGRDADGDAGYTVRCRWQRFRWVPWFDRRPWSRWGRFHRACGFVTLAALVFVPVGKLLGIPDAMFYGEAVAVIAFSTSWLSRGLARQALILRALVPGNQGR